MKNVNLSGEQRSLLPDFLIIGAGKSGTTSLDNYLRQHPDLYLPPLKEPNFFGYELNTPEDFLEDPGEARNFNHSITNLADYLTLFKDAKPAQIKGETSNSYLYHENAPSRIKHYIPHVKLIVILRQPAQRLWSRYLHLARDNRLPSKSFVDCLDKTSIWWKRNDLIPEGYYFKNLSRFYTFFPKSQIKVYLYEDLRDSCSRVIKDIFEFLGVDSSKEANLSVHFNQSGFIKDKKVDQLIGTDGFLQRSAKMILGTRYRLVKENMFLQKVITHLRKQNLSRPKIESSINKQLLSEVYGEDIRNLQHLINRDLSNWIITK